MELVRACVAHEKDQTPTQGSTLDPHGKTEERKTKRNIQEDDRGGNGKCEEDLERADLAGTRSEGMVSSGRRLMSQW